MNPAVFQQGNPHAPGESVPVIASLDDLLSSHFGIPIVQPQQPQQNNQNAGGNLNRINNQRPIPVPVVNRFDETPGTTINECYSIGARVSIKLLL